MRFLPHAHRISLLSPAPVFHIFHSCRPSMPRKQKAALVPTPIKQSHKAMAFSYKPQTLRDTIHTVLPGEVLPAIPSYSEFIAVRLFVFQLTASRRGWRRSTPRQPTSAAFQLTASRRGWRNEHVRRSWAKRISTHSLTKRLTRKLQQSVSSLSHFNSQPHEEADCSGSAYCSKCNISTHSLTKRLTEKGDRTCEGKHISTHSLTKRLTHYSADAPFRPAYFNSQPHEEADRISASDSVAWNYFNSQPHEEADRLLGHQCSFQFISTHSLTKRLTENIGNSVPVDAFQLTASRRGWRAGLVYTVSGETFQLTASRRGWPVPGLPYIPTLHISTHSLTKRLTGFRELQCTDAWNFNSQPHEEADRRIWRKRRDGHYFNSQPHEEADDLMLS